MRSDRKHLQVLRPSILIGIGFAFAFIGALLDSIASHAGVAAGPNSITLQQIATVTATPGVKAASQVGSTGPIVVVGFVIGAIVILPAIFRRATWTNK